MHISNLDFIQTSPSQSVQFSLGIVGGRTSTTTIAFGAARARGNVFAGAITGAQTFTIAFPGSLR